MRTRFTGKEQYFVNPIKTNFFRVLENSKISNEVEETYPRMKMKKKERK